MIFPPCTAYSASDITAKERIVTIIIELIIILAVTFAGAAISIYILPMVPGNIIGLVLMILILSFGLLKSRHIEKTGDFLLRHMPLFFIPHCVAVVDYIALLEKQLIPFLLICIASTVTTFAATAFTVRFVMRVQQHMQNRGNS